MENDNLKIAEDIVIEAWKHDNRQIELSTAIASALRSRDEQHRRESEERRKSQVIVELYNDGKWWCVNGPGCKDFACCGHDTFKDWYMAVKTGVKLVANFRASQLGSKEKRGV